MNNRLKHRYYKIHSCIQYWMQKLVTPICLLLICIILYAIFDISPFSLNGNKCWYSIDIVFLFGFICIIIEVLKNIFSSKEIKLPPIVLLSCCSIVVLLINFCSDFVKWQLNSKISMLEVFIGLLSVSFVICGGYIAIRQLKESAQSNKLSSFKFMIELLQSGKARKNRKIIFGLYNEETKKTTPYEQWDSKQKNAAQDTIANFDLIGLMIRNQLLDPAFLEGWEYSIYKILYILGEFIKIQEASYSYSRSRDGDLDSDYLLGIAMLRSLRNQNKIYNFE